MVHALFRRAAAATTLALTLAAAPGGVTTRDFRIETDQTNSNLNDGNFSMPHRVKFFRPGTDVVGDSATGNYKAGTVTITGNVVMHDSGQSPGPGGAAPSGGASTLNCNELQVDSKRKIYIATGNVVYVQGTRRATAQSARLDQAAHTLDLTGDVTLADGDQTLAAQVVHYNTLTKDVSTSGNPVTLIKPAPPPGSAPSGRPRSGSPPPGAQMPGEPASTLPTPHPAAKATSKPK
jgi:lipopolysaccharide assembly outer membrane protein LptD (OstA)